MGVPSAVLYRSDIVKSRERFFPGSAPCADIEACYMSLQQHDFGFVHQILSFERIHDEAQNAEQIRLNAFLLDRVVFLVKYGRAYLTSYEFDARFSELLDAYYQSHAAAFVNRYPEKYWEYHKHRLKEMGLEFDRIRLLKAVMFKVVDLICNPKQAIEKMLKRIGQSKN